VSLDEAYLDVSENKTGLPTATQSGAHDSRTDPLRTELTASAGVAPNKFLAKIASDWEKPEWALCHTTRRNRFVFIAAARGSSTRSRQSHEEKLKQIEVQTIADLRRMDLPTLEGRFGRYGVRLYDWLGESTTAR